MHQSGRFAPTSGVAFVLELIGEWLWPWYNARNIWIETRFTGFAFHFLVAALLARGILFALIGLTIPFAIALVHAWIVRHSAENQFLGSNALP